jgi:toxin-antitoxin system PIN domain toxin
MSTLADVNVVFGILVERHAHHAVAWNWWEGQSAEGVLLCLPVRLGVLRLLTNARVMEGVPVNPDQALAAWDEIEADERTSYVEGLSSPASEHCFRRNVAGRVPTPNLWADALLAAWAEAAGFRLASFDGGFRSFPRLDFEWLQGKR